MKNFTQMTFICLLFTVLVGCMSNQQSAHNYAMPNQGNDIIGKSFTVKVGSQDTMPSIAAEYDVGLQELKDANPHVNHKQLLVGQKIKVPRQYILPPKKYRNGIVINVAELRLYYFSPNGDTVATYPVALGREKWRTPVGTTSIVRKKKDPSWRVPASIRKHLLTTKGERLPAVVPPGEDNPLGKYALYLGKSGYLIHGTNAPDSIGRLVSSGCIRMYNQDVEKLFHTVSVGTPVHIIHYPNKAGWHGGKLYLESHKALSDKSGAYAKQAVPARVAIAQAAEDRGVTIDDSTINKVVNQHLGDPTEISQTS